MKSYIPQCVGTITKYVFVDSPYVTPQDVAIAAYEISRGIMIKETCFGCQITGNRDDVEQIIFHLRKLDPYCIYVKDRGFPPGDARRCRADLGGARPGYLGHEYEMSLMCYISHGLRETDHMTFTELEVAAGREIPVSEDLDINILDHLIREG